MCVYVLFFVNQFVDVSNVIFPALFDAVMIQISVDRSILRSDMAVGQQLVVSMEPQI